jgi:hypothetical protein
MAAAEAYGDGIADLARMGPAGSALGESRLAEVRSGKLVIRAGAAVLALRWEAIDAGGRLFPALDADITLTPAGGQASLLRLVGVYRPPCDLTGAGIDQVASRRVGQATIGAFISRLAEAVVHQVPRVTEMPPGD